MSTYTALAGEQPIPKRNKFSRAVSNLLDIFISRFYSPIHLRPIRRRVLMLYLELFAEFGDHLIVEICTIIYNDPLGYTVSTD